MSGVGFAVGIGVGRLAGFVYSTPLVDQPAARLATTKLSTSAVYSGGLA
jgi:hypothetical protein